jgi:Tfp pilus assembly protein FimV
MANQASEDSEQTDARNLWTTTSHVVLSPEPEPPQKPQDQALNRACEACRISKVRCLVNPDASSSKCQRCAKSSKTCVFAPPAKRRQRKRTDVRVTELEKEIQQMRSLLKTNTRSSNDLSDHDSGDDESDAQEQMAEKETPSNVQSHSSATTATSTFPTFPGKEVPFGAPAFKPATTCGPDDFLKFSDNDIINRGIISVGMASELLGIWRNELVAACPGITIPKHWDAFDLRAST